LVWFFESLGLIDLEGPGNKIADFRHEFLLSFQLDLGFSGTKMQYWELKGLKYCTKT